MPIAIDEVSKDSQGGTERMKFTLEKKISPELLDKFQIICSRVRDLDPDLKKIYWLHDLPEDPESAHLADGGWDKFDMCVFVSHWQMNQYMHKFGIPWEKCRVLLNAIEPIDFKPKSTIGPIKFIYHTTPHRGLELLVPAFIRLCEIIPDQKFQLDVFSSFEIYGPNWAQRDEAYKNLFDICKDHPNINYHGFQPNDVVREALQEAHIFAYPSIWQETSCIALIEAMSAGCLCVHPDYAALPETSANLNHTYHWDPDPQKHVMMFFSAMIRSTQVIHESNVRFSLESVSNFVRSIYGWDRRINEWNNFLNSLLVENK